MENQNNQDIQPTADVPPKPPQPMSPLTPPQEPVQSALPGFVALLKGGFALYKSKFTTIVGILLPVFIAGSIIGALFYLSLSNPDSLPAFVTSILFQLFIGIIFAVLAILTSFAFTYVLSSNEKLSVTQAFKGAGKYILSMWWLSILTGLIITGGFGLFIIPGIIFTTWFVFAFYILFNEDLRGMNAVLKSKEYVRGIWWKVFGRIVGLSLILIPINYLLSYIAKSIWGENIWVSVFEILIGYLFITPIAVSYYLTLYNKVKELKGEINFVPTTGKKAGFIIIGIIGIISFGFMMTLAVSTPFVRNLILNQAGIGTETSWTTYTAEDESFSVLMPSNVQVQDDEVIGILKGPVVVDVGFRDYPSANDTGDQEVDLQNHAESLSYQLTTFQGYNAVDFSGSSAQLQAYIKGRAIIAGNKLYNLVFLSKDPSLFKDEDYNKFINSFEVLNSSDSASENDNALEFQQDTQRLSDLASLKIALGIYVSTGNNLSCEPNKLYKSFEGSDAVDGTGWIPVDLTKITGGSPVLTLPLDPINTSSSYYSFACDPVNQTFELNAALKSSNLGPGGSSDKSANDGGDNPNIYEVGTDLTILNGNTGATARDAKRIDDLLDIQSYLELYYNKCGFYPGLVACSDDTPLRWVDLSNVLGLSVGVDTPNDPDSAKTYFYGRSANGQSYILGANLETNNSALNSAGEIDSTAGFTTTSESASCADASPTFGYCIGY